MAAKNAPKRATQADIDALPPNMIGEIVGGVLYTQARPRLRHSAAGSALGEELGPPFKRGRGGPGGWIILDEPELHLGEDVLVPDLAGWRRERMPELPDTAAATLAPDWACEILSESTAAIDRGEKMPVFAREKVAHVWLVDVAAKTHEVFRLDGESYRIVKTWHDDAKARAEPFDAIELDLTILWAR